MNVKFFILVALTTPLWADSYPVLADFPTYSYFAPCGEGVNCAGFGPHLSGDYGMNGLVSPVNEPAGGYPAVFTVTESNDIGEVIGLVNLVTQDSYLPGNAFGVDGAVRCVFSNCGNDESEFPIDINNNGLALFRRNGIVIDDFGSPISVDWTAVGLPEDDYWMAYGLNDQNQILANIDGVDGVLSPIPEFSSSPTPASSVPEPSSLLLLLPVLCLIMLLKSWRRTP